MPDVSEEKPDTIQEELKKSVQPKLSDNVAVMEAIMGQSVDVLKRDFMLCGSTDHPGAIYFLDGMADATIVDVVLKSLITYGSERKLDPERLTTADIIRTELMINASVKPVEHIKDAISAMISGDTLVFIDGVEQGMIVSSRGWKDRGVEEPASENNVRGPRDGFTETIRTNTANVRRRIRDPHLRIEPMVIGTRTMTDINIAYIQDLVKPGLVDEVKKRLDGIKIDAILESGYIEELIEDSPLSPFNTVQSTERPDKAASALLEGRVVIFIDNTPVVLIVPTFFWQFIQAPDDYYNRYWVGSFFRIVRYFAFLISLLLPSIYVMLVSFHHEMIPTQLALTIASGREVVPFPVLLEALIMELAFELMREAGLRMPKPIGQAVSIVGSLIIGQAAVQAGLVSPFMVIVVAITGISSFAIPSYSSSLALRMFRFPILLASGTMGLLGFAATFFALLLHALSIRSFGEPYLTPLSPYRPSDQRDMMLRAPMWMLNSRPGFAQDQDRMGHDQMPAPPKKDGSQ
ncbi:spore germination protein KA [Paenibacillus cellulosilyticus]|uniref:Spore germination protein KA n=1 Tax=Paenibacillus cellulosilyticus TaxID=375489 RepID=A0A2V2YRB0_9BACL|nr:spore germination protein [Paenibacillus cellulosilyticus]PWV98563.1 spore germination protein KA [Paenibacillus cellulosilyticus]QKS44167.1 spore germination protein [Paenibacillus cellulosilyticus]